MDWAVMKRFLVIFFIFALLFRVHGEELLNPKFVFLFIGDGMGATHAVMTQAHLQQQDTFAKVDFLEFPVQLPTATRAADKSITDSAAGASAIACGVKSNKGALGVDSEGKSVESIAEHAKKKKRKIGMISSTNLNNPTIAAFCSHTDQKRANYLLGMDLINAGFDFLAGGVFLNYISTDKRNLYDFAEENGYTILRNLRQINELNITEGEKILATVPRRMEYNRHPRYGNVTLAELVQYGIDFLMNEDGFLIVVEGGLIGINSHANQTNAVIGEMMEFCNAVNVAYEFVKRYPQNSLIIVTGDQEIGDLQTMDNRNFYWKSYGSTAKNVTTYISGANQEYFIPKDQEKIDNTDIGKKLKEMIQ